MVVYYHVLDQKPRIYLFLVNSPAGKDLVKELASNPAHLNRPALVSLSVWWRVEDEK
jgi:hypothetical protein